MSRTTLSGLEKGSPRAASSRAAAKWKTPHELKADLRSASILKNNRVVFNICGTKYRIVVLTDYERHGMLIRFVGTHEQYDAIEDIEHIRDRL